LKPSLSRIAGLVKASCERGSEREALGLLSRMI
jgi:hypothetical protein